DVNEWKMLEVSRARRQRDDGRGGVAVAGFDLVDMGKVRRRLKALIELESPPERDRIAIDPLQVGRRGSVCLDLVALPVECYTSIVVRRNVNGEDEGVLSQVIVERLVDVGTKLRVAAIRNLLGCASQCL